nr:hypothetical protein 1634Bnrm1_p038 [Cryptomonas sp.]
MIHCYFIIVSNKTTNNTSLIECQIDAARLLQFKKRKTITIKFSQPQYVDCEFFSYHIFNSNSIGSLVSKKISKMNVLFEMKFRIKTKSNTNEMYMGHFSLKNGNLVICKLENFCSKKFDNSKIIKNNPLNYNNLKKLNLNRKEKKIQCCIEEENDINYTFNSINSKLSTSFVDETFIVKLIRNKEIFHFSKSSIINNFEKNLIFSRLEFFNLSNLYIFLARSVKKNPNSGPMCKYTFSSNFTKSIRYCYFFVGFFNKNDFILSSEIIFYNKKIFFNPSRYLFSKYLQIVREKCEKYLDNFFNNSCICVSIYLFKQLKKDIRFNLNKEKIGCLNFEKTEIIFQKQYKKRLAEKLWNFSLCFIESHVGIYIKKYKTWYKNLENLAKNDIALKWTFCIICILVKLNDSIKPINKVFDYLIIGKFKDYYSKLNFFFIKIKGWNNADIDSEIFKKTFNDKQIPSETYFSDLIFKKFSRKKKLWKPVIFLNTGLKQNITRSNIFPSPNELPLNN